MIINYIEYEIFMLLVKKLKEIHAYFFLILGGSTIPQNSYKPSQEL